MLEKLSTPKDLEEAFQISEATQAVWRCNKRYNFPYLRIGRLIRYRPSDVEAWLKKMNEGKDAAND